MLFIIGNLLQTDVIIKITLIFLAHSTFDRVVGYRLKYYDSLVGHTHLGWVGKRKKLRKIRHIVDVISPKETSVNFYSSIEEKLTKL